MKQLLIRADDIGYSYAVNVGIARTVHEGLIRSVGVMPNMPETARGVDWVRDADIAIGQHTNLCLGTPCSDPAAIPSLVDENGQLKSSRTYRKAFKRGEDFVVFEEAVAEIEAQLARFLEVVGRDPDYFEAHAVVSENLNRAIEHVACEHGYRYQAASFDPAATVTCGTTPVRMVMRSMAPGYDPAAAIRETVEEICLPPRLPGPVHSEHVLSHRGPHQRGRRAHLARAPRLARGPARPQARRLPRPVGPPRQYAQNNVEYSIHVLSSARRFDLSSCRVSSFAHSGSA